MSPVYNIMLLGGILFPGAIAYACYLLRKSQPGLHTERMFLGAAILLGSAVLMIFFRSLTELYFVFSLATLSGQAIFAYYFYKFATEGVGPVGHGGFRTPGSNNNNDDDWLKD